MRRPRNPDGRAGRRALVAEGALSRLSFGVIGFALPLYAVELGLSLPEVGALVAANTAVAVLLKPLAGAVADRIGPRRGLVAAMLLRTVLSALYAVAATPVQLLSVRCLHGAADAARDPSVAVLVAEAGGGQRVARSFAWYQTAKTSAGAAGKALAGVLITLTGAQYDLVFAVAAGFSLLPTLVVARWVGEQAPRNHTLPPAGGNGGPRDETSTPSSSLPPERTTWSRLRPSVLLGLLVSATTSSLSSLFPVLATEYAGLTPAQAGALYLLTPVLAFSGPGFGWLSDRSGRRGVLAFRGLANAASSLLYLLAPGLPGFMVGKALDDLGKAAFRPAWGSLMADLASERPEQRARAMGVLTVGEDVGEVMAPVVAGLVWHWWGVVPLLVGRALLSGAAELQAWRVERLASGHRHRPEGPARRCDAHAGAGARRRRGGRAPAAAPRAPDRSRAR